MNHVSKDSSFDMTATIPTRRVYQVLDAFGKAMHSHDGKVLSYDMGIENGFTGMARIGLHGAFSETTGRQKRKAVRSQVRASIGKIKREVVKSVVAATPA